MSWSTINEGHANTLEPEMVRLKRNLKKQEIDRTSWQRKATDIAVRRRDDDSYDDDSFISFKLLILIVLTVFLRNGLIY